MSHARELCDLSLKFLFLGSNPKRSLFPRPKMGPGNQYFGFEKPLFIDGFFKKKERRKPQLTCFECFHFELKIFKETVLKSCMHFWKKHTILTAQFKLDTKSLFYQVAPKIY